MEGWNVGRLQGWKVGSLEGWKVGRLEGWKVADLERRGYCLSLRKQIGGKPGRRRGGEGGK